MSHLRFLHAALCGVALAAPALADDDDFQRVAPKAPAPNPPAQVEAPTPTEAMPGGQPGDLFIERLKAVVFLSDPAAVRKEGAEGAGVVFQADMPNPDALRKLLQPHLGEKITRAQLNALLKGVVLFYRGSGRPVVDVLVPEQDVTGGVLQILVIEGHVAKVEVTGNRWFSSGPILDVVDLHPGDALRTDELKADIDALNQNPFRETNIVFHPGEKLGQTDLTVLTKDRFPARFYTGYEDSGNPATGGDRYLAGFNYGDLFGLGQQVNYQYMTSGDDTSFVSHSGSWVIPLPWRHTLTFFGDHVTTNGSIPSAVANLDGTSYQASARYAVPLPTLLFPGLSVTHSISGGYDYKYNQNSLLFSSIPTSDTAYEVHQFVADYLAQGADAWGITTAEGQLYYSPGGFSAKNGDAAFDALHSGATADYVYGTLSLTRLERLPWDWSLLLKAKGQWSDANLTPSEQMAFGGYDTVRGYDEQEVAYDTGYLSTVELHTPGVSLANLFAKDVGPFQDNLYFLGFWDYGTGHNHQLTTNDQVRGSDLSSVGVGLRYALGRYLTVRFDYGWQLHSTGNDDDHGSRGELGAVLSF